MTDIFKLQNDVHDSCERLLDNSGLGRVGFSDLLKETYEGDGSNLKEFLMQFDPFQLWDKITSFKTEKEILNWFETYGNVLTQMVKYNGQKKLRKQEAKNEEILEQKKKATEDWNRLREESKRQSQDLKDISDEIKRRKEKEQKIIDDITRNKNNPSQPSSNSGESFDDRTKREYIEETERKLKEKKISDAKLSQKLGVSDWKVEMNKSYSWRTAQTFSFSINDAIRDIEEEKKAIVCDYCKETKVPYPADSYEIPSKKKKFCSLDCKSAWEKENKGIDKDEAKEIKEKLQEIKDYLKKNNENATKVLNNLITWMKKEGIINITLSNDKIVVELSGNRTKTIEESDLTSEQRAVKNFLQSNSNKKSISRSEVEKMVVGNYNEERGNKGKNGNAGIIVAIVVVGAVLAVFITLMINKNNKRSQ